MNENVNERNKYKTSKYKYNFKNDAECFVDDLYTIENVKSAIYDIVLNRNKEEKIREYIEKKLKECKFGKNIVAREKESVDTWDLKYVLFFSVETGYVYLNLEDIEEDLKEYIKRNKIIKIEVLVYFRFNETFEDLVDRFYDAYLRCVGVYLLYLFDKFRNLKDEDNNNSNRWEYNNYKFISVEDNVDSENSGNDRNDNK